MRRKIDFRAMGSKKDYDCSNLFPFSGIGEKGMGIITI